MATPYRRNDSVEHPPWFITRRLEMVLLVVCGIAIGTGIAAVTLFLELSPTVVALGACSILLGGGGVAALLRRYGPAWSKSLAVLTGIIIAAVLAVAFGGRLRDSSALAACRDGNIAGCPVCRTHSDPAARALARRTVCESGDLGECSMMLGRPEQGPPDGAACRVLTEACSETRSSHLAISAEQCASAMARCSPRR